MATIRDVARHARVSTGTVSNVLSGRKSCDPELAKRVQEAARKLDYRPNALARGLVTKKTRTLGLMAAQLGTFFSQRMLAGAESMANALGYSVLVCNTDLDPMKERSYLRILHEKRVDGVLFATYTTEDRLPEWAEDPDSRLFIPYVLTGAAVPDPPTDCVVIDNVEIGLQATNYLISMGHSRIAYVSGPWNQLASRERCEGYKQALAAAGIPLEQGYVKTGNWGPESGHNAAAELFASEPAPTAVFSANDAMAFGAMQAIRERGLRIPEDVSVVGCDDHSACPFVSPPLTTVSLPLQELASLATRLLIERVDGLRTRKELTVLKPGLVIRRSCRPPAQT